MAIAAALVGARGTGGGNTATTTAGTTSASGSTFVAAVSWDASATSPTVSDNKGNTYTGVGTPQTDGLGAYTQLFVCQNGTGGSSHTATFTTSGACYPVIHLVEITGAATASLDKNAQTFDSGTPYTVTSPTLSQADEIVICVAAENHGGGAAYASSNTTVLSQEQDTGSYWTSAVSYAVVASTSAFTPSWTRTVGGYSCGLALATFKQSSGGGGGATRGMPFGPGTAFNGGRTFRGIVC